MAEPLDFSPLETRLTALTDVGVAIKAFITDLQTQLVDNAGGNAKILAIAAGLDAHKQALVDAMLENTPAQPA